MAEPVDAADLKSVVPNRTCEFKSRLGHQHEWQSNQHNPFGPLQNLARKPSSPVQGPSSSPQDGRTLRGASEKRRAEQGPWRGNVKGKIPASESLDNPHRVFYIRLSKLEVMVPLLPIAIAAAVVLGVAAYAGGKSNGRNEESKKNNKTRSKEQKALRNTIQKTVKTINQKNQRIRVLERHAKENQVLKAKVAELRKEIQVLKAKVAELRQEKEHLESQLLQGAV